MPPLYWQELAELRHCKNEGMKIGLLVLVFGEDAPSLSQSPHDHSLNTFPPFLVGSTSYLGLRVAPVRHTLSSLQIHGRYHPLMAGGRVCSTSRRYCLHTHMGTCIPISPPPSLPPSLPPSPHTMKGVALISSYIAAAVTTRRCIDQRKRNR